MTNDQRDKMIRETHETVGTLKAAYKLWEKQLDQINAVIGGNGTEGLTSRVVRIEESHKVERRPPGLFVTSAAAMLVTVVAAVLSGVIVAMVAT